MRFLSNPSRINKESGFLLPLAFFGLIFLSSLALVTLEKVNDSKRQALSFLAYSQAGLIADSMLDLSEYHLLNSSKGDQTWEGESAMCKSQGSSNKQIVLKSPECKIEIQCDVKDIVVINCNNIASKRLSLGG